MIFLVGASGGCHFFVEGLPVGTDNGPGVDLAASEPGDLATPTAPDLAQGWTGPGPDLGAPDLLATPEPDLLAAPDLSPSPCVNVTESFASAPTRWTLLGDASYDAANQRLQLTSLDADVAGSAFLTTPMATPAFDARFSFRIADGTGGDGMAFVFAKAAHASDLVPFGNHQPGHGYGLGYRGMNGFAVELDTFQNLKDPDNNHVGFMRASDGTHLLTGTPPDPPLHSGAAHRTAHIRFDGHHVTVKIDDETTIDDDLPDGVSFTPDTLFFGFTGANGGWNDRHGVLDLTLIVGPAGICFP